MSLKLITILSACILVGMPLVGILSRPPHHVGMIWMVSMIVVPLLIFVGAAFFMIRGYRLTTHTLFVQRLGWHTALPLDDLLSAEVDPAAMKRSMRLLGNGGLFCFAGTYRNRTLGVYRAFATDPKSAVVLRFTNRTVVITPDHPGAFVTTITSNIALGLSTTR